MKAHRIHLFLGACVLAIGAAAHASDRDLFMPSWQRSALASAPKFLVPSAQALIDEALEKIIPVPYSIILDETVPPSVYLTWAGTNNWMQALQQALAPIGLEVSPNWANNEIVITWAQAQQNAPVVGAGLGSANYQKLNGYVHPEVVVQAKRLNAREIGTSAVAVEKNTASSASSTALTEKATADNASIKPSRRGKFSVSTPIF